VPLVDIAQRARLLHELHGQVAELGLGGHEPGGKVGH
jgi:hypothetical protein